MILKCNQKNACGPWIHFRVHGPSTLGRIRTKKEKQSMGAYSIRFFKPVDSK
jgi:hypothetical protein